MVFWALVLANALHLDCHDGDTGQDVGFVDYGNLIQVPQQQPRNSSTQERRGSGMTTKDIAIEWM